MRIIQASGGRLPRVILSALRANHPRRGRHERGFALFAVTVFVFIVTITAFGFFTMASYETEGALYRQESSESFHLADGAIERARAKFLEDRSWRAGWTTEPEGRGTYDLAVQDTVYMGDDAVYLLATGRVGDGVRSIEVMADVPPTGLGVPLLLMGDADVGGNLCLYGHAHVNGDADFGPNDVAPEMRRYLHLGFRPHASADLHRSRSLSQRDVLLRAAATLPAERHGHVSMTVISTTSRRLSETA